MKVLIVNTYDNQGGAAKAAFRLHEGLLRIGVDSNMLVQHKATKNPQVFSLYTKYTHFISTARLGINQLPLRIYQRDTYSPFSPAWVPLSQIHKKIKEINPDIVHLHWVVGGMFGLRDLLKINKPIVWTLHDMWPFTGGCHYDKECGKFETTCQACPILNSRKTFDLSMKIFQQKYKIYNKLNSLTIVGPSNWMSSCARKSRLLGGKKIYTIPNPIDTDIFKPMDLKESREILSLDFDKKIILFGADSVNDPLKGMDKLINSLKHIKTKNVEILIFGRARIEDFDFLDYPVHNLGRLNDENSLRMAYATADVTILPSLQENLSNVVIESLACGTPVVAFNIGGNSDMIDHKNNGYIADFSCDLDLSLGIDYVLNNNHNNIFNKNSRNKVMNFFETGKVSNLYKLLYDKLLS
jgi:glycosyltransferase involved in cell wall biosynthesis